MGIWIALSCPPNSHIPDETKTPTSMQYKSSQHFNNSHKTALIQTVLSPYVITPLFAFLFLATYRVSLNIIDSSNDIPGRLQASTTSNTTYKFDHQGTELNFNSFLETVTDNEQLILQKVALDKLNWTRSLLEQRQKVTLSSIDSSLKLSLDAYSQEVTNQQHIQSLVQSLNASVSDELRNKSDKLERLKTQLEGSVSVGQSVDVGDIDLDITGVEAMFSGVLNQITIPKNDDLLALNETILEIFDSIESLFKNSMTKLDNYSVNISTPQQKSTSQDQTIELSHVPVSSVSTYNNHTLSLTTPKKKKNESTIRNTFLSLGCCIIALYFLIIISHHVHFQCSSRLRKLVYIELQNDLEKENFSIDKGFKDFDEQTQVNFNLGQFRLQRPYITIVTDYMGQYLDWRWNRIYWVLEYFLSNLPYLFFVIGLICVTYFGVATTKLNAVDLDLDVGSSSVVKASVDEYNVILPTLDYEPTSVDSIETMCDFLEGLEGSLGDDLQNIFDKNNITQVLGVEPIVWVTEELAIGWSSLDLNNHHLDEVTVGFNVTTLITTESGTSLQSVVQRTLDLIAVKIRKMVLHALRVTLLVLGVLFLCIVLVGVVYSFSVPV